LALIAAVWVERRIEHRFGGVTYLRVGDEIDVLRHGQREQ